MKDDKQQEHAAPEGTSEADCSAFWRQIEMASFRMAAEDERLGKLMAGDIMRLIHLTVEIAKCNVPPNSPLCVVTHSKTQEVQRHVAREVVANQGGTEG